MLKTVTIKKWQHFQLCNFPIGKKYSYYRHCHPTSLRDGEYFQFDMSGASILKNSYETLKFDFLDQKTLEKYYYTNICDEGKGNSSILHVRGKPF